MYIKCLKSMVQMLVIGLLLKGNGYTVKESNSFLYIFPSVPIGDQLFKDFASLELCQPGKQMGSLRSCLPSSEW